MSASDNSHNDDLTQSERFKKAARDLKADENEEKWTELLKKIAKPAPKEEKPAD